MYSNKFRRLRPLASASPAQTEQPLLPELCPHPPPKRTTEGIASMCAAETPRLRPHPPPKKTTEGIASMCAAETPRLRPHPPPKRSTEDIATVWEFQHNSKTSFKLPPIFGPSQTRGLCPYPQAQGVRKPVVAYSISTVQLEEDLFRQKCRSEFLEREKRKEALCPQRQHPSQEKSASLKRELKATKAPNANRVQLKGKEPEALERKVSEHKIKREEMVLTEPEEPEEGNSNPEEMDLTEPEDSEAMDRGMDFEVYLWHHKNDVDEFYDNMEVIKCHQYKIKKMKEKEDRIKAKTDTLIKESQKKLKTIQAIHKKNLDNKSVAFSKIEQISEKLAKVYGKSYGHFSCPEFLFLMLNEFHEWSFDLEESTPAETLHKQQMEFWKDYYKNVRVKEQAELDALKEERWQRRREQALERALAPPVKISGKKLMPRSPPLKKVVKKVETKKRVKTDEA